ncbi:MAG TPA: LytTR family DNA-binding domain-containing protein [Ferruginibacter sp.]|nr:LytTR family DNA-binding domain-containing protein [Ferruginibacter sp.]
MLTAIIIDDEQMGRIALKQKLKDYCKDVNLLGEARNGEEGIQLIESLHPDIVFLDIEMPRMGGFDMLNRIPKKTFHLIFTTAYDQYAIKAIRYAAFDYLLKPIDIEELKEAVSKIKKENINDTEKKISALEQNLQSKSSLKKLAIHTLEGLLFFDMQDIIQLEASSNYTTIYFNSQPKLLASKTLKDFEELLPDDQFFRSHHSHIINLKYIKRYIKGDGGKIEMKNGRFADVSRRKKEEFLKLIGQ